MIQHSGLTVKPTNYIYPPRAQDCIPITDITIFAQQDWTAQLKYNDSRCLIKYLPNGQIELWNRHAEQFRNYNAPDSLTQELETIREKLNLDKNHWHLLDGGLLHAKHAAIKNTIVIWDILVHNSTHLLSSTYHNRHDFLVGNLNTGTYWFQNYDLGILATPNIIIPRNYTANLAGTEHNNGNPPGDAWISLWENTIKQINKPYGPNSPLIEGLVFKDKDGKLERGMKEKNNSHWMCRSRVQTGRHMF